MKIAVCVSGVPGENSSRNFRQLQKNFPSADFYIGTWQQHETTIKKEFPNQECFLFDEPKVHYHPWLDMPRNIMVSQKMRKFSNIFRRMPELHEVTKHQAKQIIAHAHMVNSLPEKYDVIIRTRFDTFTSTEANFDDYIQDVYDNKTAIGFAFINPEIDHTFNGAVELVMPHSNLDQYILDHLIMHHGDQIDTLRIFNLYRDKKLCPAEYGWYQVLSQPYNDNHRCISGWASAEKFIPTEFLKEAI